MFGFKKKFVDVKIRNFEPLTDNDNTIDRKNALLEEIKPAIDKEIDQCFVDPTRTARGSYKK